MKDAREKAKEMVDVFYFILPNNGSLSSGENSCDARMSQAIQCAIDSIDEILEALSYHEWQNRQISDYYRSVKSILQSM